MSNLKVNSKCNMCGSCLSLGYDFLSENDDGSIAVKSSTYINPASETFKNLKYICPVGAFEIEHSIRIESPEEQLNKIKGQLKQWPGLKKPSAKDISFNAGSYEMSLSCGNICSGYEYSSESAVMNAAEREFNNSIYSKMDIYILQVISQYRVDKISPYYTYGPDTDSVYYKENQKVSDLLRQAQKLSNRNLGTDFSKFEVYPYRDFVYKMLSKGELVGEDLVPSVHSEFKDSTYTSLSDYRTYINTDYIEKYAGRDFFGNTKYKDAYRYNLVEAILEFRKDLTKALEWQKDHIESNALGHISYLLDLYNKEAKDEILRKVSML